MNMQVTLTAGEKVYDISGAVGTVEITDNIDKAGICTFPIVRNSTVIPAEGNAVRIQSGGVTWFAGYIVKTAQTHEHQISVTAYDQLFYLKAEDTFVFTDKTLTQVVQEVCALFGLKLGLLEDTKYNLGRKSFDGKAGLDTIIDCRKLTTIGTKELFYIKDEGGLVVLRNIKSAISTLLVDPASSIFGYSYERSIDGQTANQIKLVRDNKATGKRELYVAMDSGNIKKWGLLQHYEKLDDQVNPEQAKEKADALLALKNRVQQTLSIDVLGEKSIRAGNLLFVSLPDAGLKKYLLCISAKHSFSNTVHTVKVTLRVV